MHTHFISLTTFITTELVNKVEADLTDIVYLYVWPENHFVALQVNLCISS